MERVLDSIDEEPDHKKKKLMMSEVNTLENSSQDQMLSEKQETVNDGEVVLLDYEETKDVSIELVDANINGEVSLLESEELKDVPVVLDDRNSNQDVLLPESEIRKDVSVVSNNGNNKEEVPLSEREERKDFSVVSNDSNNNGDVPLLESEEQRDISVVSDNRNNKQDVPLLESEERKDTFVCNSRKMLLVLDLNGLLADIVGHIPRDFVADVIIGRRAIFKRPFYHEFLNFCFERFEVGIWSSRTQRNVERITDYLLGELRHKLLFCWDMSHCAKTTISSLENQYKYVVFKELNRLWEKHDPNLPWEKGDYNETNTLLLDDSPYKALLNPPYTAIFPHSYAYQNRNDNSLGEGGELRNYLEKLAEAENVQEFVQKNPFGQEAITETSDSWEFYSQLIGKT